MKSFLKIFYLPVLIFCSGLLHAQKVRLKNELSASDLSYLQKQSKECFSYEANIGMSFQSQDLYANKHIKPDKPCSLKDIEVLEKKLNGTNADAEVYSGMANLYKRLNKTADAQQCSNKALDIIRLVIETHPDSAGAYNVMGVVYMGMSAFNESADAFTQALRILPNDSTATCALPMIYLLGGQFDSAYAFIKRQTDRFPNDLYNYSILPVYYMYKTLYKLQGGSNAQINSALEEDLIDMKLLKEFYEKDTKNVQRELLYYSSRQVSLAIRMLLEAYTDSTMDMKNVSFRPKENERIQLTEGKQYFSSCLKRKDIPNVFMVYKALGNIYLLLNEVKTAIPFLKKAIELKPLSVSTTLNNAAEDYDNLAAAYFLLKDTANYEKALFRKFNDKPAIDPKVGDYLAIARIYIYKNQYDLAAKTYREAMALDNKNAELYLGLSFLKLAEGQHKPALDHINTAYALDKNNWKLFFLYGVIMLEQKDALNAYICFMKAKELSSNGDWIQRDIVDKYFIAE